MQHSMLATNTMNISQYILIRRTKLQMRESFEDDDDEHWDEKGVSSRQHMVRQMVAALSDQPD